MNSQVKKVISLQWIELIFRWLIGVTFVYASYHKILEPGDFARIIYGYDLFPKDSINLIAIILPFIELVGGLALIMGICPRAAILLINLLLLLFIIALSINFIRGHQFDCGCFSSQKLGIEASSHMLLVRDLVFFVMGLFVMLFQNMRWCCLYSSQR